MFQFGYSLVVCCSLSLLLALVEATNYCSPSLCSGSTNIGCNNNGAWSSNCPTSPTPVAVTFNQARRKQILKAHNVRRNKIAGGKLAGYKPAKRMATMRWNAELAKLALLNVKQCEMKHDACHNTDTFKASGQNLAIYGYSGARSSKTTAQLVTASIQMWWNEYKDANMSIIKEYPSNWSGPFVANCKIIITSKLESSIVMSQLHIKFIGLGSGNTMQSFEPNKELSFHISEPITILSPSSIKVYAAVKSFMNNSPPTTF
ncbi:uncharacterized protein Dwil_GK18435 [Drosophila willistoni]|uniref:SCP domain-containing protein n=1 Tax=Drosophila willistoni TaxID=7260 RepID=B4NPP8_DROWI|nr:uncharacterized protein Dwil_GK18435 [Drosophila willistoni]